MIIRNGTVAISRKERDAYTQDGRPNWRRELRISIPAQIVPLEQDALMRTTATGRPVDYAKYMILIDARDIKGRLKPEMMSSEMDMSIQNGTEAYLRVISVEYLRAVSQYKIIAIQRVHG